MLRIGLPQAGGPPEAPPNPEGQDMSNKLPGVEPGALPDDGSQSETKIPQQLAGYMGPEAGPFECEHCVFFRQPRACLVVIGDIDPHGCCNNYTPGGPPESDEDEGDEEPGGAEEGDVGSVGSEAPESGEM